VGQDARARGAGEPLTQGVGPDRHTAVASPTDLLHSLSRIDFREHPANCVLDLQLPAGGALAADKVAALARTFAHLGGPTLQLNCVSADEMRNAQVHPEAHRNLVVRTCGLSAHFVSLTREVQDEIIGRAMVSL
jgi:pyruvate-formate lyase